MTARSRWHFGGGPGYCEGCHRQGRPCAKGEPGQGGELCAYVAHAPLTEVGWQAWDVLLRCSGQLRVVPGAVIGIDFGAAFAIGQALGYDALALAELLPAAEAGMVSAINTRLMETSP